MFAIPREYYEKYQVRRYGFHAVSYTHLDVYKRQIKGSAMMLEQSGQTPDELIQMVASPGGTTLAALREMDETGFDESIQKAMEACTKRAEELGK